MAMAMDDPPYTALVPRQKLKDATTLPGYHDLHHSFKVAAIIQAVMRLCPAQQRSSPCCQPGVTQTVLVGASPQTGKGVGRQDLQRGRVRGREGVAAHYAQE